MKIFRLFIVIFPYILAMSLYVSYAQEVKIPTFTIDYKSAGEHGERFNKGYGQCVDFVKQSRSDLLGIGVVGTAANMPNVAKEKGFVVNNLPREGSVIVMPDVKIIKTGEITGHVGIVTDVKELKDSIYTLTIRDANAKNDIKYDKDGKIIQGSSVIERTVTYDIKEKKVTDEILKEQSNIVFIHEKMDVYNAKQEEASKYVAQIFNVRLGREPTAKEKNEYRDKLISGVITPQQMEANIKKLPEYEQRIAELRKEIEKSKGKNISEHFINELKEAMKEEGKKILKEIKDTIVSPATAIDAGLHIIGIKVPIAGLLWPKTALAPTSDPSTLAQRTAGDISVTVTFTQELSGLYTQTPDYFLAPGAKWSMTNISGTRTGEGSIPGNFTTGSGSGRLEATRSGYVAGTISNAPFTIETAGTVSVSGKAGQPLTGTMTSTFNTTSIENVSLTGDVEIYPDGRLNWTNVRGDVTHSGVGKVGEIQNGTINQGPTR